MSVNRLVKNIKRLAKQVRDERIYGTLGRGENYTDIVAPRAGHVWITLQDGNVISLANTGRGQVPLRAGLPVRMLRLVTGELVLDGYDERLLDDDAHLPGAHGVLPHAASHQDGGTDEVGTATPTANALIKSDADGYIGAGWLDPADLAKAFTDLTDTFASYTGLGGYVLKVKATEDGVEAVAGSYTQEEIEDFVGAMFAGNTGLIDAVYDDGAGTITLTLDVSAADKMLYSTAADTWAEATITSFARTLLDDTDAATARATLGITAYDTETVQDVVGALIVDSSSIDATYNDGAGTLSLAVIDEYIQDLVGAMVSGNTETLITVTYQDSDGTLDFEITDAELTALAGLVSAADRLPYFTGLGTASLATFTTFGRSLVDDTDATTARATLGITIYDAETMQDAIGSFWADSSSIDITYNDAGNSISAAVIDEYIQDLVGAMLTDGNGIDLVYTDASGIFSAALTTLGADWDFGTSFNPIGNSIAARSSSGFRVEDDGGNAGVIVADGGETTIGLDALVVTPTSGGIAKSVLGGLKSDVTLSPGSITSAQTWTITVTNPLTGSNRGGVVELSLYGMDSATAPGTIRLLYKAVVAFTRTTVGATAVIRAVNELVLDVAGVTVTGPTAIADGFTYTVHPTAGTLNRSSAILTGIAPGLAVASAVA